MLNSKLNIRYFNGRNKLARSVIHDSFVTCFSLVFRNKWGSLQTVQIFIKTFNRQNNTMGKL